MLLHFTRVLPCSLFTPVSCICSTPTTKPWKVRGDPIDRPRPGLVPASRHASMHASRTTLGGSAVQPGRAPLYQSMVCARMRVHVGVCMCVCYHLPTHVCLQEVHRRMLTVPTSSWSQNRSETCSARVWASASIV